jgi:pyrroloquinoline quinone biosynthesis protein D
MNGITSSARPAVGPGFRLQWEPVQDAHVLLYPEGMVKLNRSAAAIMTRCDGARTIDEIVADLEQTYGTTGLSGDVLAFIELAVQRSWLKVLE